MSKTAVLVMTRVVDAPRAAVFSDWMKPEQLVRWWRSRRTRRPTATAPLQPGDAFRVAGVCVVVRELVWPERLVFTWGGEHPGTETVVEVRFADDGPRTTLTLEQWLDREA